MIEEDQKKNHPGPTKGHQGGPPSWDSKHPRSSESFSLHHPRWSADFRFLELRKKKRPYFPLYIYRLFDRGFLSFEIFDKPHNKGGRLIFHPRKPPTEGTTRGAPFFSTSIEPRKNPPTFHYTSLSIGILIMVYYSPCNNWVV